MPIAFPNIPLPFLPPLYYADIVPGAAPYSASLKCLLVGMKNSGMDNAVDNMPYLLSGTVAESLFGRGSMLWAMYNAARLNAPTAEFWGVSPEKQNGSVAAKGAIRIHGVPSLNTPLNLWIAGRPVSCPARTTQTAADIAKSLAAAINRAKYLPVFAQLDDEDDQRVIVTCRWVGASGNEIYISKDRWGYVNPLASNITITPMSVVQEGTGTPLINAALAGIGRQRFDVFASPASIVSEPWVTNYLDAVSGRWSYAEQLYGHWFSARRGTVGNHVTWGLTMNDPHQTTMALPAPIPSPTWEWAAAIAAHATVHWAEPPELSRPLQSLKLKSIVGPDDLKDVPTLGESNSLLDAGMSTWALNDFHEVLIQRLVTHRRVNDWGDPDPAWRDAVTMFQTSYFARRMRQAVTNAFPRAALTDHDTGIPGFASPAAIRDLYIHEYKAMERLGLVENSDMFADALIVERNENDANRLDSLIRPDLVNQLRVVANLIETYLQLDNSLAA